MELSEREAARIRKFVCGQLRDEPDLSTLTLGILKKQYLAHTLCDSLSPEARNFMKQVVQDELMKMQDNDKDTSESETKTVQNKRKREDDEVNGSEDEDESTAKKPRVHSDSSSSSESEDEKDCKTGGEDSDEEKQIKSGSKDEEQEVKKSQGRAKAKQRLDSEDSTDGENNASEKEESKSSSDDSPKEDEEDGSDIHNKSENGDKSNNSDSSDSEKDDKVLAEKKNNQSDSDSSSLPSLEDENEKAPKTEKTKKAQDDKKKKTEKKEERKKTEKDDNRAVVRLKRFIALCGVRRNYQKLLGGCRSIRSQVAVLKKELEDLGVDGRPTLKKCQEVRMKRDEAEELAALDVSNIISTKGRPKRAATLTWKERFPPTSTYVRSINSDSNSDQENDAPKTRRASNWTNLQGIISDDADSD